MKKVNKSGFTLLEILVVIIIVGVLASVAMPLLFQNVERSRASEALNTLGVIRRGIETCGSQFNGNGANCGNFDAIGITNPSSTAAAAPNFTAGNGSSHFDYVIGAGTAAGAACAAAAGAPAGPVGNAPTYRVVATRVALDNGTAGDLICLDRRNATGVTNRSGTGAFAGIQ